MPGKEHFSFGLGDTATTYNAATATQKLLTDVVVKDTQSCSANISQTQKFLVGLGGFLGVGGNVNMTQTAKALGECYQTADKKANLVQKLSNELDQLAQKSGATGGDDFAGASVFGSRSTGNYSNTSQLVNNIVNFSTLQDCGKNIGQDQVIDIQGHVQIGGDFTMSQEAEANLSKCIQNSFSDLTVDTTMENKVLQTARDESSGLGMYIIIVIIALCIAAYFLLKRRKKKSVVNIEESYGANPDYSQYAYQPDPYSNGYQQVPGQYAPAPAPEFTPSHTGEYMDLSQFNAANTMDTSTINTMNMGNAGNIYTNPPAQTGSELGDLRTGQGEKNLSYDF